LFPLSPLMAHGSLPLWLPPLLGFVSAEARRFARAWSATGAALGRRRAGAVDQSSAAALPGGGGPPRQTFAQLHAAPFTRSGARGYVPPPSESPMFDNDGTLWSEQPMVTPSWPLPSTVPAACCRSGRNSPQFPWLAAAAAGNARRRLSDGTKGLMELVGEITPRGPWTPQAFEALAREWFKHRLPFPAFSGPTPPSPTGRCWSMLELLRFQRLRHLHRFRPCGAFLRAISQSFYGNSTGAGDSAPASAPPLRRPLDGKPMILRQHRNWRWLNIEAIKAFLFDG